MKQFEQCKQFEPVDCFAFVDNCIDGHSLIGMLRKSFGENVNFRPEYKRPGLWYSSALKCLKRLKADMQKPAFKGKQPPLIFIGDLNIPDWPSPDVMGTIEELVSLLNEFSREYGNVLVVDHHNTNMDKRLPGICHINPKACSAANVLYNLLDGELSGEHSKLPQSFRERVVVSQKELESYKGFVEIIDYIDGGKEFNWARVDRFKSNPFSGKGIMRDSKAKKGDSIYWYYEKDMDQFVDAVAKGPVTALPTELVEQYEEHLKNKRVILSRAAKKILNGAVRITTIDSGRQFKGTVKLIKIVAPPDVDGACNLSPYIYKALKVNGIKLSQIVIEALRVRNEGLDKAKVSVFTDSRSGPYIDKYVESEGGAGHNHAGGYTLEGSRLQSAVKYVMNEWRSEPEIISNTRGHSLVDALKDFNKSEVRPDPVRVRFVAGKTEKVEPRKEKRLPKLIPVHEPALI